MTDNIFRDRTGRGAIIFPTFRNFRPGGSRYPVLGSQHPSPNVKTFCKFEPQIWLEIITSRDAKSACFKGSRTSCREIIFGIFWPNFGRKRSHHVMDASCRCMGTRNACGEVVQAFAISSFLELTLSLWPQHSEPPSSTRDRSADGLLHQPVRSTSDAPKRLPRPTFLGEPLAASAPAGWENLRVTVQITGFPANFSNPPGGKSTDFPLKDVICCIS